MKKDNTVYYLYAAAVALAAGGAWYYFNKKKSGELGGTSGVYKEHWWNLTEFENKTWGYAVGLGTEQNVPLAADSPFADATAAQTAAFNAIDQMTEAFSGVDPIIAHPFLPAFE